MTLQELLKAQNLTDEQVKGILDAMKQNKIYTASEENLDVRYGKLKTDHDAMVAKDAESQKLIAELQKATKGQEDVQTKITEYEATIQKQQEELAEAKTESALKIGLLSAGAKATDIDYLIYKMNHDSDWKPELGEDGQVKGYLFQNFALIDNKSVYYNLYLSIDHFSFPDKKERILKALEDVGLKGFENKKIC